MIKLTGLNYTYSAGGEVLSALNLNVSKGSLVGLVGANGSGKSTLMALMAGLYTPTSGSLEICGRLSPGAEKEIRSICRMVMQDADLQILGATVEEDLLMGRKRTESAVTDAKAMAERFDLLEYWDSPVQTLSWGMKRKVCLGAALLDEPEVIVLDEPFSGLDYPGMREMRRIISENRQAGLTQVVSSHDIECFVDLVDDLAVLNKGRLVLSGPPESILDQVHTHGVRPPCSWISGHGITVWDDGSES